MKRYQMFPHQGNVSKPNPSPGKEKAMKKELMSVVLALTGMIALHLLSTGVIQAAAQTDAASPKIVQAQAILTVADGKRLIAKGVARMPIVQKALKDGMVIIVKGSTNAYVTEEITGKKVDHAAFVRGRTEPTKGGKKLPDVKALPDVVIEKGKVVDLPLEEAVKKLKAGDVVIKGANALDYRNKLAAVNIGHPAGGTTGITYPYVVARKAHLIIPVGLEKVVVGDVADLTLKMREPIESLNGLHSMFLVAGNIVTELEAIEILTGAKAFQSSAGGISGAEGGSWIVFRGDRATVNKALKLVQSIQGEPPYHP